MTFYFWLAVLTVLATLFSLGCGFAIDKGRAWWRRRQVAKEIRALNAHYVHDRRWK